MRGINTSFIKNRKTVTEKLDNQINTGIETVTR